MRHRLQANVKQKNSTQTEQESHDRGKGEHHDKIVQRHLAQGEIRLAIGKVAPDENHCSAGRRRQNDEARNVAVNLTGHQVRAKQITDEKQTERRHGKRFDRPVDEQGHADPTPVLADLTERGKVDLYQHWDDHQPDQDGHRNVDLGDLGPANGLEFARKKMSECDANNNAKRDPNGQIAFKYRHEVGFPVLKECCLRWHGIQRPIGGANALLQ
mgnify:CR=1 FL=1